MADYAESTELIDGRAAVVIQGAQGSVFIAAAHVGAPEDGPTLTLWVSCDDADGRDAALRSLRTITFTAPGS